MAVSPVSLVGVFFSRKAAWETPVADLGTYHTRQVNVWNFQLDADVCWEEMLLLHKAAHSPGRPGRQAKSTGNIEAATSDKRQAATSTTQHQATLACRTDTRRTRAANVFRGTDRVCASR